MIILTYDCEGVLVCDQVTPNTTVDGDRYTYFLRKKLRPQIHKLRLTLLETDVFILQDSAQFHSKDIFKGVSQEYGWETLPHTLYLSDLSSPDYDEFKQLKN